MTARSLITLFTDAGFCPDRRIGVWAAWAKCDGRTMRVSGVLRGPVPNSTIAELRALVNGVHCVLGQIGPVPGAKIIAQSDSQIAITVFQGTGYTRASKRVLVDAERERMRAMTAGRVVIEYRHVSAHKGTATPRNAVNTWCDLECRRHLKAARALAVAGR